MRVTLHTTAGPEAGRRIDLRDGLTASIGRSEWSDFSFETDQKLADVHFAIRCERHQCVLEIRQKDPTLLNGEPVGEDGGASEVRLHTSDKISAGATEFTIDIEGDDGRENPADAESDEAALPEPLGVAPLVGYLDLDDEHLPLAEAAESDREFLAKLIEQEHYQPASRLQAHLFEKNQAVWWGCLCLDRLLGDDIPTKQKNAKEAARNWAVESNEDNRRRAEAATEIAEFTGPGGILAAAAFWSGGSLAPPDSLEPVPPEERLTGQSVANAVLLACLAKEPERMAEKLKECLEIGRDLVEGKIELPSPPANVGE